MEVLPETLCLLYNLQALDLDCPFLQELPESIKKLVNLRYFQLSSNKIQNLPESIFLLRNLHTLSLLNCTELKELPRGIQQLINLHIIDLPRFLINIPFGIGKLTALKPLSGYFGVMDQGIIGGLGELKYMNNLSGFLHISGLQNLCDVENSRSANLASKPNLDRLILNFQERQSRTEIGLHLDVNSSNNAKNKNDQKMHEVVLESLQPHGNLRLLKILHYEGRNCPSWLLNSLLPKLTLVILDFCTEANFLPPFAELRYLKFLKISCHTRVRNNGDELKTYSLLPGYGSTREVSYPSLEELSLRNMLNLVELQAHDGDFPSLKKVTIDNCPKLWKIAKIPQAVRFMMIRDCGCHELQLASESKILNFMIYNCPNLVLVQSMGSNFPYLEKISVRDCPRLCKFTNIHKLPALKCISLYCCPELWLLPTIPEELEMLKIQECGVHEIMLPSRCEKLIISNCLQLSLVKWRDGDLYNIVKVIFEYCPQLKLLAAPAAIMELVIHECGFHDIMSLSVSDSVDISNCLELTSINWMDGCLNPVKEVAFMYCPKLEFLKIPSEISELKIHECGFREIMFKSISQNISISNCLNLISAIWTGRHLSYVREVTFKNCPYLEFLSFPSVIKELKMHECGFREIMFESISENISISNCLELNSIKWGNGRFNPIREGRFEYCPKMELIAIPDGIVKLKIHECGVREIMFPYVSESLTISNCIELILINWVEEHLNNIEEVIVEYCPKLTLRTIPTGMKKLKIAYCGIQEINFPHRSNIELVDVSHCPVLASIYWVERDTLKDSSELQKGLKTLRVSDCPFLQLSINKGELHAMTKRAEFYDCPRMDLGTRYVYQRETATTEFNLFGNEEIHLSPASVNPTIQLLENPLRFFFSKEDPLEGESFTSAPSVEVNCQSIMLNLAMLVILEISKCSKVISVTGLDNLNNLKCLSISYCTELSDWKDKRVPLSLKFLELESCDKLSSFPSLSVENQPSFLKVLVIRNCPLLTILEGFHGMTNLKTMELMNCRNLCISPATESLFRPHKISISGCPIMKNCFQRNNNTYYEVEFNPADNPQNDSEAEQESADSTTNNSIC